MRNVKDVPAPTRNVKQGRRLGLGALWVRIEKNTEKMAIKSFTVPVFHKLESERNERTSEQVSIAERATSSAEQAND